MIQSVRQIRQGARRALVSSRGARRYLAPGLTLEGFFATLKEREVPYVVLRWFEPLPAVDPGEDIDILVADEHLSFVHTLLVPRQLRPGAQKFDVYSTSGMPGSDFAGIPYYAPRFSQALLDDAVWLRNAYRVPSPQHHFESLAYHAVYHKGYASGLVDTAIDHPSGDSDHDYAAVLSGLAAQLGLTVEPTLDGLDEHLAAAGLRPPMDTMERLLPRNPWIGDRFIATQPDVDLVWRGLAVFVLRDRAASQVEEARAELDRQGFEVLEEVHLDEAQRAAASHRLRGGNWARGPWPLSGGGPAVYLVAYDVVPRVDDVDDKRAVNQRIPQAKERLRRRLLHGVDPARLHNPVHSSDNPHQALDYLEALDDPALLTRLRTSAGALVEACTFPYPVLRALPAQARRAQVAVVEHPVHGACVCKVFRPGAARYFEREVMARTELGDIPEMPELLEAGPHWFLTPLYVDDRRHVIRALPAYDEVQLRPFASRALARVAASLHERGLFLLDLSSQNLLSDPVAGLKLLDLEFLQSYAGPVPPLRESYTFRGVPAGLAGGYDAPQRWWFMPRVGNPAFHPAVTGLQLDELIAAPTARSRLSGPLVQLAWYAALAQGRARAATRAAAARSPWGKRVRRLAALLRGLAVRARRRTVRR